MVEVIAGGQRNMPSCYRDIYAIEVEVDHVIDFNKTVRNTDTLGYQFAHSPLTL